MSGARLVPVDDSTPVDVFRGGPTAVVIGNFDGVHRGHQAVLTQTATEATSLGLEPCALTFDPHPAQVVGGGAPPVLTTLEQRVALMGDLGIRCVYARRFDEAFAAWSPERFARDLLAGALEARLVVIGENFRFGAKRKGDLALLRVLGGELGFDVHVHGVASDARGPYSSTRARDAIVAGDLAEAANVLGRPHALTGIVARGDARGRKLGFPTANLEAIAELLPPDGVYAVTVDGAVPGQSVLGVTNIGLRPTVSNAGRRTVETFLLDFDGDLYGVALWVRLRARLRGEEKFGSLEELRRQIDRDVERARAALA
ncbi:MAG: bifunctional riboflavin kinase/FAD synthetase [Polyangiaceae bacterium]|nr:bifunctional riboflavin kinase/FAD synthetase [Polyangiaceae bacterium]